MTTFVRVAIAVLVLLALGAGGLILYAESSSPPKRTIEQVLPDDRIPG